MRITQESHYALQIVTALASGEGVLDAKTLSERTSVTQRFALKILHKLVTAKIAVSFKGVKGGYSLKKKPEDITLRSIIELIDGPIVIARCLGEDACSLNQDKSSCIYHHIFEKISFNVAAFLDGITIADILSGKNDFNF